MKNIFFSTIAFLFFSQNSISQEKIKADLAVINFLGKSPYKSEQNSDSESLLSLLYFKPQPVNNPKIGYMNAKGKIVVKSKYGMASDFYEGYANIITDDSTYGYIDKKGNETLFKQYDKTYFWYGNTGIATVNNKSALIDRKGNPLTEFIYEIIYFFGFNNFKGMISKDESHILNNKGKVIFSKNPLFNIKSHYFEKDSLLIFEKEIENKKLRGLIGLDYVVVVEPKYDQIYFIEDKELFAVKKDKKYGFINKSGVEVIPLIYDQVALNITEDLIAVNQNNKCGFINRNNEIIIPFEYDETYPFFDGVAFVKKENFYIAIDKQNNNKFEFGADRTKFPFFSNKLCVFKENNKYGYINKKGKAVISAIYDYAYPFVNGMAYVELNGKSGSISKKGKKVIPIKYKQLWLESEGLFRFVE